MADPECSIRQCCGKDIFGAEARIDAGGGRGRSNERGITAGREGDGDRLDLIRCQTIAVTERQRTDGNGMARGAAGKGLEGQSGRNDLPGCAPAGENAFRLFCTEGESGIKADGIFQKIRRALKTGSRQPRGGEAGARGKPCMQRLGFITELQAKSGRLRGGKAERHGRGLRIEFQDMRNCCRSADGAECGGGVEAVFVVFGPERQAETRHGFQPDDIGRDEGIRR
ncbi:hypothetical protein D3C72_1448900 [compost metagenome]